MINGFNSNLNEGFKLEKKDLNKLLNALRKHGQIIGPKKMGKWLRMELIRDASEIEFKGISWFTSKKHVFPEKQTLFKYNGNKIEKYSYFPKKVLFGLRMCDLNAFKINDRLFLEQSPPNENYRQFRENLTLVGLFCDEVQDKYCFCSSMDLTHYYDLCLFDKGTFFHIKSGSTKGDKIIEKLKLKLDKPYFKELPEGGLKLSTKQIGDLYENQIWQKGVDDCLSCGDCTTLCPTCLCFDVQDEPNIDLKSGVRKVKWDSCMYKDFTLVAGEHVYRNTRTNRFKHRIYHKLDYYPKKFDGESMCTGCGRCIRGCPTKIDWVGLVNEMVDEKCEVKQK